MADGTTAADWEDYGEFINRVELEQHHSARPTPLAVRLLHNNKDDLVLARHAIEEDYHEVDEWLHQELDQCEHIDLDQSLCVAVEHDKWDEAVVDLKDSMISTIHEVVPEEKLAEADDKINTMFKRLKFTKSTKQGIDLVDLNFEREGLQLMAGWAVVYWKDEKHKYFAFAQAGCAWQNNEAYALRSGTMCNNKILGKAGNWLKYKSMGNLLVSLGDKTITDAACS
mmetsp:Transcript_32555/g.64113  ORF Transcript_32555/g.64113 Transcript_32555/m.64113 type:complete len:226 (-) Transcript_32555:92-769(-)